MNDIDQAKFTSPLPLYRQVKDLILARIRSGEWQAGFRIPSENRLVQELSISRMTINRALRELMHEGFLARVQGVGTFVKELPRQTSLIELRNIAEEIRGRGHTHSATVIDRAEIVASIGAAEQFSTAPGAALFHLRLLHHENHVPVQLEDRIVNPEIAPEFLTQDFRSATPTEYLVSIAPVSELEHVVKAVMPTPAQQELLEIEASEPCLMLHRRTWSWGKVASVVNLIYPASRYELRGRYETSPLGAIGGNAKGAMTLTQSG